MEHSIIWVKGSLLLIQPWEHFEVEFRGAERKDSELLFVEPRITIHQGVSVCG
jgi:hypothetical protein